jgi:hypothetical protein
LVVNTGHGQTRKMAKDDTKRYSRSELGAMKARAEVRAMPAGALEIELNKAFWDKAQIVETRRAL